MHDIFHLGSPAALRRRGRVGMIHASQLQGPRIRHRPSVATLPMSLRTVSRGGSAHGDRNDPACDGDRQTCLIKAGEMSRLRRPGRLQDRFW